MRMETMAGSVVYNYTLATACVADVVQTVLARLLVLKLDVLIPS